MLSKIAIRKRAQRAIPLDGKSCSKCGSTSSLSRHHHDYSKPLDVVILCRSCHQKYEHADNNPNGILKPVACKICGTMFKPKRGCRSKLCGNPECLKKCGQIAAKKRWGIERKDSNVAETASLVCKQASQQSCLLGEQESSDRKAA